jgi:hypothetical protein
MGGPAPPSRGLAPANEVHDHGAHDASGVVHEVKAVLEQRSARFHEPKVPLVHERRGVEQDVAAAGAQAGPRHAAKLSIGGGEQLVSRLRIAFLRAMDQVGQVDRCVHCPIYGRRRSAPARVFLALLTCGWRRGATLRAVR